MWISYIVFSHKKKCILESTYVYYSSLNVWDKQSSKIKVYKRYMRSSKCLSSECICILSLSLSVFKVHYAHRMTWATIRALLTFMRVTKLSLKRTIVIVIGQCHLRRKKYIFKVNLSSMCVNRKNKKKMQQV